MNCRNCYFFIIWDFCMENKAHIIVNILKRNLLHIISFDHDLGDVDELKETLPVEEWFDLEGNKEYTGMDCAKWLVDYCLDNDLNMPDYLVHSDNPAGRDNINGLLASYNKMRNKTTE